MNVLVVSEPGVDGVFRYVENLCHHLVESHVQVHFAYSDRRGCDRLKDLVSFVEDHHGETLNLHVANRPSLADWKAARDLRKLALKVQPDVIHSHSSKAGALARALSFSGIRSAQVYQPHAYVGMRPKPGRFDRVYNSIEAFLGKVACTITCSLGEWRFATEILKIPETLLFGVRHGVDTETFRPISPEEKRTLRRRLGLPLDAKILGFIGRSSDQKDPVTLYRAFASAAQSDRRLVLFHVGQGELDERLKQETRELGITDRVYRKAYMGMPADFYQAVDGFILTSVYEGFSLSAVEALAADLPMILSDSAGNQDMLALPLSHAWSAHPGEVLGFSAAIREWAEALPVGSRINHREIALSQFQTRSQMEAILGLYDRLTSAQRARVPLSRAA